jgi:hypothetical protein
MNSITQAHAQREGLNLIESFYIFDNFLEYHVRGSPFDNQLPIPTKNKLTEANGFQ